MAHYSPHICTAALLSLSVGVSAQERQPNVILLFSDQHNADVFGWTGHPDAITPNLDRMARTGVVFNRAYCQDAISVASRTSLFTGLYPRTTGILDNNKSETEVLQETVSLQRIFQANGYATYAFGKRHLFGKADEGWTFCREHNGKNSTDYNYVEWIGEQGYAQEFGEDWAAEFGEFPKGNKLEGTKYPKARMGTRPTKLPADKTMEAFSARNTIEIIRKHARSDEPFFCFTSFYRPHQPYTALPEYLAHYDNAAWGPGANAGGPIAMPPSFRQPATELPPALARQRTNEKGIWCLGLAAKDEQLYRDYMASYYALVEEIDHWVGEIFAALEEEGLAENTIVIYASDHGDFVGAHGMIEKCALGHNVYEETLRIPLICYWKGKFPEGYASDELVGLIDLFPTLVELAGLKLPKMSYPPQGMSLAKPLLKQKSVGRDWIVSENWSQAAVITSDRKLGIWLDPAPVTRDFRSFGEMLFRREDDPAEIRNVFHDPDERRQIAKLRKYYEKFIREVPAHGKEEMKKILSDKKHKPQRVW